MRREIKFRAIVSCGESKDKMVYGHYYQDDYASVIRDNNGRVHSVNPNTLGQLTPYTEHESDSPIYEGDIVEDWVIGSLCQIVFTDYGNFGLRPINFKMPELEYETIDPSYVSCNLIVRGDIHLNPELLNNTHTITV